MLTDRQRHRLAKEARKLAMECVEGTAPRLGNDLFWNGDRPVCALAHVAFRAGVPKRAISGFLSEDDHRFALDTHAVSQTLADALRDSRLTCGDPDYNAAAPFALLALADALDELRAAPSPTPNTRKER